MKTMTIINGNKPPLMTIPTSFLKPTRIYRTKPAPNRAMKLLQMLKTAQKRPLHLRLTKVCKLLQSILKLKSNLLKTVLKKLLHLKLTKVLKLLPTI